MRRFAQKLIAWQKKFGRHDLPWQGTRDPYRIWLSEIMLQQTQVTTVIPYYQRFLATFPSVQDLAQAPLERVLELWSGLGYYSRARNLHRAAQLIKQQGHFPRTMEDLHALPGIGRSTAAAICVFAYATRAAILEGNVKRVLTRFFGISGYPGDIEARLWQLAQQLLPQSDLEAYTQGLMDLGSSVCTRRRPLCTVCPVRSDCVAHREQRVAELPTARPRRLLPEKTVRLLLLMRQGELLFERRPPTGIWGGLWSLPELDTKINVPNYCAQRFNARIRMQASLPEIKHGFTHFNLTLIPQPCWVESWPLTAQEPGLLWLAPGDAAGAALPAPIKRLMRTL